MWHGAGNTWKRSGTILRGPSSTKFGPWVWRRCKCARCLANGSQSTFAGWLDCGRKLSAYPVGELGDCNLGDRSKESGQHTTDHPKPCLGAKAQVTPKSHKRGLLQRQATATTTTTSTSTTQRPNVPTKPTQPNPTNLNPTKPTQQKVEVATLAWARQPRSPEYKTLLEKLTSRHLSAADKADVLARL